MSTTTTMLDSSMTAPSASSTEDLKSKKKMKKKKIPWKVYAALTLATWGDNMWGFAGGLFMMELSPDSLRLTATYGLVIAASVICLGAAIGRWIDNTKRLTAARFCLLVQNASVSICSLVLSLYLSVRKEKEGENAPDDNDKVEQTHSNDDAFWGSILAYGTIVIVIIFSTVARLATTGTNIIMQKDWIVVIADNDNDMLAEMNSVMRTIGLTTYMLAPVLVGQLFSFVGYVATGVVVAVWNLVSVGFEYTLLEMIYRSYPALQEKGQADKEKEVVETLLDDKHRDNINSKVHEEDEEAGPIVWLQSIFKGWLLYFVHPIRNAGLGLALLYMTVLGFDNITYGYVLTQGIPEFVLGILVAVSAALGVAGSTAYPFLRRHVGLERTGLFGMFFLVFTSSISVLSVFLPGSPFMTFNGTTTDGNLTSWSEEEQNTTSSSEAAVGGEMEGTLMEFQSVGVLLTGITLARFGLWITDLTVTQILQERVEENHRGVINGVQDSLNNLLDLIKCILVILLPYTWQFGFLIMLSFTSISAGWLLYALYSRKVRGHLFHFNAYLHGHFHVVPKGDQQDNNKTEVSSSDVVGLDQVA